MYLVSGFCLWFSVPKRTQPLIKLIYTHINMEVQILVHGDWEEY